MENAATRFGQRLAHTEKKYRDQALKKLTVYLTKKSEWSALEWDKLWKALFYCMWMSDKRPIQEELSTSLSQLVHKLPTTALALGFVHSFFRTMHREWHGIDGLRLDKFYSLVRKFVHESIALLRNNDWEHEDVEVFVSIISSEVVSQLPNGLRMHLSDVFLEETWKAAGASVETDAFLLLLEPFFTLLSSEYDKAVFKRVRELVFLPMLSEYKFGPQSAKQKKKKKNAKAAADESGETDGDDEEEEEDKVFELVELAYVQHRLFAIASADDTAERNRSGLYSLYSKFFALTKVDSLKAAQEEASKPKASLKKKKNASKSDEPVATETPAASDAVEKKSKKNKKRKKNQVDAEEAEVAAVVEVVPEAEPEKTKKSKKQKTAEKAQEEVKKAVAPAVVEATEKKSKKSKKEQKNAAKAQEEEEAAKKTEAPVETSEKTSKKQKKSAEKTQEEMKKAAVVEASDTKSKKSKKSETGPAKPKDEAKKQSKKEEAKKQAEEPATAKKTKEPKDIAAPAKDESAKQEKKKAAKTEEQTEKPKKLIIVKSGIKFQRCSVCKGFGKGFLPGGKDTCGHCERNQKAQKKAAAVVAKKRKASEIAASTAAAEADAANAKKVTFGKNKALPHELSVKRLKASAKKDATPKEEASIKGVLKATSVPPTKPAKKDSSKKAAGKGRMKAADFF